MFRVRAIPILLLVLCAAHAAADDGIFDFDGHTKLRGVWQTYPEDSLFRELVGSSSLDTIGELRLNLAARTSGWSFRADYQLLGLYSEFLPLGQPGDALLLIAGGDPTPALPAALQAALERDMPVVALVTDADRELVQRLPAGAAVIRSGAGTRSRELEMHTMILLALCQLIDIGLFGPRD